MTVSTILLYCVLLFIGSCIYHTVPESTLLRDSMTMTWTCCVLSSDWLICLQLSTCSELWKVWVLSVVFFQLSTFLVSIRNIGLVLLGVGRARLLLLANGFRVVGSPPYPQPSIPEDSTSFRGKKIFEAKIASLVTMFGFHLLLLPKQCNTAICIEII